LSSVRLVQAGGREGVLWVAVRSARPDLSAAQLVDEADRATLALIGVTLAHVLINWRVVREMREARRLSVQPKLAIKLSRVGPAHAFVAVLNAGSGTAFDVSIMLAFEPRSPSRHQRDERTWRTPSIAPGAQHEFIPMTPGNGSIMDINAR
jgi:hypothetical protein